MTDVRFRADSSDLEDLRSELLDKFGPDLDIHEVASIAPGELREPVLVSLVIALGGPVVAKELAAVVKAWFKHRETMKRLDLRLDVLKDEPQEISLEQLARMPAGSPERGSR